MKIIAAREDHEDEIDRRVWIVEIRHRELKKILNRDDLSSSMNHMIGWEANLEELTGLPSELEWYQVRLIQAREKLDVLLQSIASILLGPPAPLQPEKPLRSDLQRFDRIESLSEESKEKKGESP